MNKNRMRWLAGGLLAASAALAMTVPAAQASPKAATAPKPELPAVSYKYTLSKIAWTGSVEVIAASDSHGDLYFFWQGSGSSTWHRELVAKASSRTGYSKPAIAWAAKTADSPSAMLIVALDSAGDLVSFTQGGGSSKWTYKRIAKASGDKYQAPAVTEWEGTFLISVGLASGELDVFERSLVGGGWQRQAIAFGHFGPSSITTAYYSGLPTQYVLITATNGGSVEFWFEEIYSSSWLRQIVASAGASGRYSGASITATASEIYVTAADSSGQLDFWYEHLGDLGPDWTEGLVANGKYTGAQVAFANDVNGSPYSFDFITAVSGTGTLDFWWREDGATAWNLEKIAAAGTKAKYANPAIVMTSTAAVLTAINSKPGDVYSWYQLFQSTPWHKQLVAKG